MCRFTTVPVSAHARMSGSQCPECNDGSPSSCGISENVTALKPRSALRRTSSAATSGSSRYGSWHGMMRSRVRAGPLLEVPVVPRPHGGEREVGVAALTWSRWPAKPGRNDGKQSDA